MPSNIRNFLISFLLSSVFFSFTAYFAVQAIRVIMFETDDPVVADFPSEQQPDDSDLPSEQPLPGGAVLNILLIGTDYQPAIFNDYVVPDNTLANERMKIAETILFVSFNTNSGSLVICPIPSKTLVSVDGVNMTLGRAYHYKNSAFVADKVSTMIGVSVNYYATVTIQGLADIIDYLGGMTYDVPCDMEYKDEAQNLEIDLKAGRQSLTGDQVLQMLRYNGYEDADGTNAARTALQGQFAYELLRQQATYTHKKNAVELFTVLSPYVETNFTLENLTTYLSVIFGYGTLNYVPLEYPGAYTTRFFTPNVDSAKEIFAPYCS